MKWFNRCCAILTVLFITGLYIGQTSHTYPALDTTNAFTGVNTFGYINGHLYVDGTKYTTFLNAAAACPAGGCFIDMSGNSTALTLGTFDPGTMPVVVLLGPYSYTITQWTVRSSLQLIGAGHNSTTLTQGTAGTAPFILPSTGGLVADGVTFKGFNLQAAASSTTAGFSMVAAASGGLYYSHFEDITVGSFTPFGGNQFLFSSVNAGSPTATDQFISFHDVQAFRAANGVPVLRITGQY